MGVRRQHRWDLTSPGRTLPWYASLRPVFEAGHQVTLLQNGAEFFSALEAAIDQARRSVQLETYIFGDDASAIRIAAAMARAAHRGLQVRLLIDGYGTPRLRGEVAMLLNSAAVAVRSFRPLRPATFIHRQRLRRLHRKLALIDGEQVFVGGINILDDHVDPNHGVLDQARLDFAVLVRGPLVARAALAMRRLWAEQAWRAHDLPADQTESRPGPNQGLGELAGYRAPLGQFEGRHEQPRALPPPPAGALAGHGAPAHGIVAALAIRDNFRYRTSIERAYLRAIREARGEILIACAYFFPGERLRNALVHAASRGVQVRLLLQGRVEYRLLHYGTQALYESLLVSGIEIIEYQSSFLHAKVAVIDDWATVGSSNIDPFSLLLAREANVLVKDAGFAAQLRARLQAAIDEGGVPVKAEYWKNQPWWTRLAQRVGFVALRLGVAISGRGMHY
jgi:cardiolipin synthase